MDRPETLVYRRKQIMGEVVEQVLDEGMATTTVDVVGAAVDVATIVTIGQRITARPFAEKRKR